ncbi:Mor transcription activator family protein [Gracilibacillus ureilyticus]|uniref:Mor transcription activator family protein n=1 Tax=Gracilibacillus ureilyticus TaxID=531814 RepID=A0A1H9QPD9_9BACI|nr:CD3324 family protein [Gracilibacillus ureilyticus]SER62085.1 Mor transcription activator family protein [Gracilibacillus ureilyticus]
MKYVKAHEVLPEELLERLQEYIQGEMIYIPKRESDRQSWGSRSGNRQYYDERNKQIRNAFRKGALIDHLADEYALSIETIKKIVYKK